MRAALLWMAVESAGRIAGTVLIVGALRVWWHAEPSAAHIGVAWWCLLVVTLVVLLFLFDRRRLRVRQSLSDLGYRFSWTLGVLGVACSLVLIIAVRFTAEIDARVFGLVERPDRMTGLGEAGVWAVLPFLLGNAVLAPLVEEFAWRGHIQAVLARRWGETGAMAIAALLFAAKHVIIDLSLERVTSLVVGAFLLGLVRLRLGTFAATVAHFGLNFTASTILVVAALGP